MIDYFGIDAEDLVKKGGIHTAIEINQQPELWQKVWEEITLQEHAISEFLTTALQCVKRIILTGAGTSGFIGISLRGAFEKKTGIVTEAIPTTDIVSHPGDYFIAAIPTLIISFARSGNSPESVAAIKMADQLCDTCFHVIITCNKNGALAQYNSRHAKLTITLPSETNDISLAMTSSYSSMLLTGILLNNIKRLAATKASIDTVIKYARLFIAKNAKDLQAIARLQFNRAVFLGAGPYNGTATEASLKLQEFTDGQVICKSDSYLGFRHGPKSVIDKHTIVIYLLSSHNEYASKYEKDLILSMQKGTPPMLEISVSESAHANFDFPYQFYFSEDGKKLEDDFLPLCYILPAQMLGFYKSLELGLQPDSPSSNNDITRVVEGVQIYLMA